MEESLYQLNYELNYQLLAYLPNQLEDMIYKALGCKVEVTSTATLLMQIKRIIVMEAVEHAQQSAVTVIEAQVVEVKQYAVGDSNWSLWLTPSSPQVCSLL